MKMRSCWYLAALVLLALLLIGCGSSSSSSGPNLGPGASLLIGGSTDLAPAAGLTRDVAIGALLDAGATVEIFNFATRQKLASGTTGENGFVSLNVTPGLTVVAVVTGKRNGKDYRLSVIIPTVPNGDATYIARPDSSLAAEVLATKHFGTSLIDQDTLDDVTTEAQQYLGANPGSDISVGGGLLDSGAFGAQGTVKTDQLTAVMAKVPNTINNNVVRGKNAMRQLSEVSFPIEALASGPSEAYEPFGKVTRDALLMQFMMLGGLAEMVTELPDGVLEVLYPAIAGDWAYTPATTFTRNGITSTKLFLLPVGSGFRYANGAITPDAALNTANQITIEGVTTWNDPFRLVAKLVTSTTWQVTLEMNGDDYVLDVPVAALVSLGTNPNMQGKLVYTNPAGVTKTFNGTFAATGTKGRAYTSASFTGSYSETRPTTVSAEFGAGMEQLGMIFELLMTGGIPLFDDGDEALAMTRQEPEEPTVTKTFTANLSINATFPATLPVGADPEDATYVYPIRVDVSDVSTELKLGTAYQAAMRGTAAVAFRNVMDDGNLDALPLNITVTGSRTATTPDGTFQFNNAMQVTNTVLNETTDPELTPLSLTFGDTTLKVTAGTEEISLSGKLQVDGVVVTNNGEQDVRYNHVRHDGSITNTVSEASFTGALDITVGPSNTPLPVISTTLNGTLTRDGYQAFNLNAAYISDGQQTQTLTLNNLAYGYFSLNGSLVVDYAPAAQGSLQQKITLKLLNQDGVLLLIEQLRDADPTGNLTVNGEVVGTIAPIENGLQMNYIDGTHDSATVNLTLPELGM